MSTTIIIAPITVPIIRNQPFRSDAPELRLADDCRRGARPEGIVELQPEGDIEGKTNRSPESKGKEQRRTYPIERIGQDCAHRSQSPPKAQLGPCSRTISLIATDSVVLRASMLHMQIHQLGRRHHVAVQIGHDPH